MLIAFPSAPPPILILTLQWLESCLVERNDVIQLGATVTDRQYVRQCKQNTTRSKMTPYPKT